MLYLHSAQSPRRGITVLGLLLLIIALVIAAVFLVRYLRSRPAAALVRPTVVSVTSDV
jgi:flagellar biogenesis protein FliO